ncbi:hypothetical protein Ocin01_19206 [Orchesella cincta]|uniref:Uncharacterized protein n=1 Tax=Orchesella cincta TaxID=48709 RepID=A0A1D2M3E1_ORCCI|nr:hypothetical protein Ocin01_19206 [Orchesella cincta]
MLRWPETLPCHLMLKPIKFASTNKTHTLNTETLFAFIHEFLFIYQLNEFEFVFYKQDRSKIYMTNSN